MNSITENVVENDAMVVINTVNSVNVWWKQMECQENVNKVIK